MQNQGHSANQADTFDPIMFIKDGASSRTKNSDQFPYLYNDRGHGVQLTEPPCEPIAMAPENPELWCGNVYENIGAQEKTVESDSGKTYTITLFDFGVKEVHYRPFIATRDIAAAFGMTLLESGQCVRFPYDNLVMAEYTYGQWAAYESPYLGKDSAGKSRSRELLTINPTDLEHHAFPHVFFSQDEHVHLVITVARWRPRTKQIALADLWVKPGDALVLPPQFPPPPPEVSGSANSGRIVVNLHGNRNSAQACRFIDGKRSLTTTTILGNADAMVDPRTRPYYHEEKTATHHYHHSFRVA